MKILFRILFIAILLLVVAVGVLFAVQNTTPIALDLLVVALPERSLALWVLLAFALGGIIGMLTSVGIVWRLRAALLKTNRQVRKLTHKEPA
jgi:lipopolysaccharide assembly protein A